MARYARGVGQPAPVTGEVEKILGRPARTYAQWVADHADAGPARTARPACSEGCRYAALIDHDDGCDMRRPRWSNSSIAG
jgi:hypothetical protein